MGRQIKLSILPADANTLLTAIRSKEPVEVAVRSGVAPTLAPLDSIPDGSQDLVLWNRRFAPTLKHRYIAAADPPYYLADEQTEAILEFSISVLTRWEGIPALTQGRIYGVSMQSLLNLRNGTSELSGTSEKIGARTQFRGWVDAWDQPQDAGGAMGFDWAIRRSFAFGNVRGEIE